MVVTDRLAERQQCVRGVPFHENRKSENRPLFRPRKPKIREPSPIPTPPDASGWGNANGLRFLEVVHGAGRDARLPLVVMIHGLGDRAHGGWIDSDDTPMRVVMPQAPTPYGHGFAWFPFRAGGDPDALAGGIRVAADQLATVLRTIAAERPTLGRPIVGGFSQGGMLSYALAALYGAEFEALHPISGLLPRSLWPTERPAGRIPPIRALHGDADTLVPVVPARALIEHLRKLGYDAELGEYPGVPHRVTPAMSERIGGSIRAEVAALLTAGARRKSPSRAKHLNPPSRSAFPE